MRESIAQLKQIVRLFRDGRAKCASRVSTLIADKVGLEIGGPSPIFSKYGSIPLYGDVLSLDNVVFAEDTVWEGRRLAGRTFTFARGKPPGNNFVLDASSLKTLQNETYDFVLASHCLEHIANPIRALYEWHRVLRPDGILLLILPDMSRTFDHKRPPTPLSHLVEDYERGVGEDDLTHLPEILELHDLARDPQAGTPEQFKARALRNFENRCLHHHVFSQESGYKLVEFAGFQVDHQEITKPFHLIFLARKRIG